MIRQLIKQFALVIAAIVILGSVIPWAENQKRADDKREKAQREIAQVVEDSIRNIQPQAEAPAVEASMADRIKRIVDNYEWVVDRHEKALKEMDKNEKFYRQQLKELSAVIYSLMQQSGRSESKVSRKLPEGAQVRLEFDCVDGVEGDEALVRISQAPASWLVVPNKK